MSLMRLIAREKSKHLKLVSFMLERMSSLTCVDRYSSGLFDTKPTNHPKGYLK